MTRASPLTLVLLALAGPVLAQEAGASQDGPAARGAAPATEAQEAKAPATASGGPVAAPAASPADLAAQVRELQRKVEILGEELEAQRVGSDAPVAPATTATPNALGLSPGARQVYGKEGLHVGGYGEALLSLYATHLQNGTRQPVDNVADTLRAVLYVGYKFNDWLVFNSEYEFEHAGFSDEHAEGEVIVEFAYLDFLLAKWLNVRAGHVLLPVGFINELHEPPVFLGARRPLLESEDGLIPTTWHELGVGIHGELPLNLSYRAYVVNGLDAARFNAEGNGAIGSGRQDGHLAIANKPAVTGRLDWNLAPGALLGGSFYVGNSSQARDTRAIWTSLWELHAEYRARGFQARAIYARVTNSADGVRSAGADSSTFGVGTLQSGGYLEAGYDVLTFVRETRMSLVPFVRWERFNTQQLTAPGVSPDPANQVSLVTLGLNYKPIPQVAVKADFGIARNGAETGRNVFNVALGYLF